MEVLARDLRGLPASAVSRLREIYELDRDTQRLLAEVREEEKALLRDIRRASRAIRDGERDREGDREGEKSRDRGAISSTTEGNDEKENNNNNDNNDNNENDNTNNADDADDGKDREQVMGECTATAAAVCVSSESDHDSNHNHKSEDIHTDAVCDNHDNNTDKDKDNKTDGASLSAEDKNFHDRLRRIHSKRSLAARRLDFQVAATQAFYDFLDSKVNYLAKATEPLQSIYPLDDEAFLAEQRKKKKKRKEEVAVEEQAVPLIDPNEPLYCFCKGVSYGNMVACENEDCPIEWFHFPCVGLTEAPTDPWYCPQCAPQFVKPPPA